MKKSAPDDTLQLLLRVGITAQPLGKNAFRVDTSAGTVMYYPTSGKWQHRGRTLTGSVSELCDWIKKQGLL